MSDALELAPEPRSVRGRARLGRRRARPRSAATTWSTPRSWGSPSWSPTRSCTPTRRSWSGSGAPRRTRGWRSTTARVAPPRLRDMTDDERLLATVGRGLGIVAMYSIDLGRRGLPEGKVVWFEPAAEPMLDDGRPGPAGDVFDLAEEVEAAPRVRRASPWSGSPSALLGMPVKVFAHYRSWYEELRRELRLLALNHGVRLPGRPGAVRAAPCRSSRSAGRPAAIDRARRAIASRCRPGRPRVRRPGQRRRPR